MSNELVLVAFYFCILIYSVILHEISHGVAALWLGDKTAKYAGRLTLSPWPHIDPFGSVIIPVGLFLTTGFAFGYAKPVPYNPYNLRDQKYGPLIVALAGPGANFLLALVAALIAKILPLGLTVKTDILRSFWGVFGGGDFLGRFQFLAETMSGSLSNILFGLCLIIIFWNIVLGCFNMLPVPPLDGSRLLSLFWRPNQATEVFLEQYGLFLALLIIFIFSGPIHAIITFFLGIFWGLAL